MIKDGDGNIHVKVPISGTLSDERISDFSDAIWTAVKNVLVNVLKAPFRAIGGLFTSGDNKIDELKVDPVTFAAGSLVLSPEMERQTVRVADFMRRAPYVGLTLNSVTSPEDEEALKARAVAARLEKFQKEQGISDPAAALRRYYQVAVKDAQLPRTVDDQILLLRKREPAPTAALAELRKQRLDVTRDRLAKVEGIPEARARDRAGRRAARRGERRRARPDFGTGGSGDADARGSFGRRSAHWRGAAAHHAGGLGRGLDRLGPAALRRARGVRHHRRGRLSALLYYAHRPQLPGGASWRTT